MYNESHGKGTVRERSLFMAGGGGGGGRGEAKISRPIVLGGGPTFFSILFWRGDFFNALFCKLFLAKVTLHIL